MRTRKQIEDACAVAFGANIAIEQYVDRVIQRLMALEVTIDTIYMLRPIKKDGPMLHVQARTGMNTPTVTEHRIRLNQAVEVVLHEKRQRDSALSLNGAAPIRDGGDRFRARRDMGDFKN